MRPAHAVDDVRRAEAALAATLPPGALMDRAAAGMAARCLRLLRETRGGVYGASAVLLVGGGDNGGDALLVGARLARRGVRVTAVLVADTAHEVALAEFVHGGGVLTSALSALDDADLVVDGMVGIGGRGGLRLQAARAATRAEASGALIVAVDVPSGVDASTGEVDGVALHADVTLCAGVLKPGVLVDPGAEHAGLVEVVDIGLSPHLGEPTLEALDAEDVAVLLPQPGRESDKYRRGVLSVAAGGSDYPGAAVLCVGGGIRGGAGMVRYLGPDKAGRAVLAAWPECVVGDGRVQARVVGPGVPDLDGVRELVARPEPIVLDAAATTLHTVAGGSALLTPHAGELAGVFAALGSDTTREQIEARRLHYVRKAARRTGQVVLLKGSTTLVATPDGRVRVNTTGTSWLATAGSGDVLAGIAGAFLARGLEAYDAGAAAAFVHGLAGRLASDGAPIEAQGVLDAVPEALRRVARRA